MKGLLLLALALPALGAEVPETLKARVVAWDVAFDPGSERDWSARLESEVREAAEEGVEVLVFSELLGWGLAPYKAKGDADAVFITRAWNDRLLPRLAKTLKAFDMLVVLGSYPHQEAGWTHAFNRATVWHGGRWRFADKLDPTQQELVEDPPIRPGRALPVFSFKGGKAAALVCYSVEKPEVAARLKAAGVQLLLVPSATSDENGVGRILRTASARAVELGAAVLVAPLTGAVPGWTNIGSASLFLPDQAGFVEPRREGPRLSSGIHRSDFALPWKALLDLRVQKEKPEVRPFLAPTPEFVLTD